MPLKRYLLLVEDRLEEPGFFNSASRGWQKAKDVEMPSGSPWERAWQWQHSSSLLVDMLVRSRPEPVKVVTWNKAFEVPARSLIAINPLKLNRPEAAEEAAGFYFRLMSDLHGVKASIYNDWESYV